MSFKKKLKELPFLFLNFLILSMMAYTTGYINAFQDEKENPHICRVKNLKVGLNYLENQINKKEIDFYVIVGKLKDGEGHLMVEIKERNETKIIDRTAFKKPKDFVFYVKEKLFDFDGDKRFDIAIPCGFKIKKLKIGC